MTQTESMWKIPVVSGIRSPLQVMKEQADELSRGSRGSLTGVAVANGFGVHIQDTLMILVPELNNYKYLLCTYTHPAERIYPGDLLSNIHSRIWQIGSLGDFERALAETLGSDETVELLKSLLTQVA